MHSFVNLHICKSAHLHILPIKMKKLAYVALFVLTAAVSCTNENSGNHPNDTTPKTPPKPRVKGPAFSADSAYDLVKKQVDFGPRVPGTSAHDACAAWYVSKLKSLGLEVDTQQTTVTLPITNKSAKLINVIGSFHKERKDRVLLLAHYDSRPVADLDTVKTDQPIDGADDGGSGCAMMLEIARLVQMRDPNIGIDFFFTDAEDAGENDGESNTWCLGTQYWSQLIAPDYKPRYAILLDMVGGKNPVFPREGTSVHFAPDVVEKVWSAAANLGYGSFFTNDITGETTDDHLFVNQFTGIPSIDIVHYDPVRHDYPEWHHKHSDNMEVIDKATLQMVGNVLIDVIYNENPPLS